MHATACSNKQELCKLCASHSCSEQFAQHGQQQCSVVQKPCESARRFAWEVVVVEDKTPNAFVLPGGKIVVFTGMHLGPESTPYGI